MKSLTGRVATAGILIGLSLSATLAHAQLGDMLKQAGSAATQNSGGGLAGNLGGLGSALGGGSSLMPGSLGNAAGVLQFCIQNQFLSGGSGASSVKDALVSKLGGNPTSNSGFTSGASGILDAGNGKTLDLSGDGLKQQLTKQVCDKVLTQAKSML